MLDDASASKIIQQASSSCLSSFLSTEIYILLARTPITFSRSSIIWSTTTPVCFSAVASPPRRRILRKTKAPRVRRTAKFISIPRSYPAANTNILPPLHDLLRQSSNLSVSISGCITLSSPPMMIASSRPLEMIVRDTVSISNLSIPMCIGLVAPLLNVRLRLTAF